MTALQSPSGARARVDRIKTGVEVLWQLVVESYQARDWEALGYGTWDEMCTREFGTSRLRLPREERAETVQSLREAGLSVRAIAAATGVGVGTVHRELAPVPNGTPEPVVYEPSGMDEFVADRVTGEVLEEPVWGASIDAEVEAGESEYVTPAPTPEPAKPITGLDGRTYAPTAPVAKKADRRSDLTKSARKLSTDVYRLTNRIQKLRADDRLGRNAEQVASLVRGHLSDCIEVCQDLLDALSPEGV